VAREPKQRDGLPGGGYGKPLRQADIHKGRLDEKVMVTEVGHRRLHYGGR
jgi:hypothetical protein